MYTARINEYEGNYIVIIIIIMQIQVMIGHYL